MNNVVKFSAWLLATTLTAAAETAPDPAPVTPSTASQPSAPVKATVEDQAKLSPEVSQLVTDKLAKYAPAPASKPAPAPNPDVLELPKITVTQKKRPRLGDNVMMTTKAFNDKLAKENLSSFDRNFLNKFSLPDWFGGQSAAARAREEYDRQQHAQLTDDVNALAKVVEVQDPAQAKALRDAINRP
jgi:hypothetical protein